MKISVIATALNSAATIGGTIASFLAQGHPDKELLVIDGGSRDGTLEIARSFGPANIKIISEPDRSIYDAMNKGLDRFTGDAIGFLNSDDCYRDTGSLGAIAAALEQNDIAYGDIEIVNNHVERRLMRRWRTQQGRLESFRRGWMPPHPTFYIRRKVVERVGRFALKYRIAADYDYMLRCFEHTEFRAAYIARSLVLMQHGGASTRNIGAILKANLECLQSRREHFGGLPIDVAFFRKPLSHAMQLTAMLSGRSVEPDYLNRHDGAI